MTSSFLTIMWTIKNIYEYMKKIFLTEKQFKRLMEEKTPQEKKIINLVENRTVAAFKYRNVVDEIVKYCNQIHEIEPPKKTSSAKIPTINKEFIDCKIRYYDFIIPVEISSKIPFWGDNPIRILLMKIYLPSNIDDQIDITAIPQNGGYSDSQSSLSDDNTHLIDTYINIECYSINKRPISNSLANNLFHELNHATEDFNRQLRAKKTGKSDSLSLASDSMPLLKQAMMNFIKRGRDKYDKCFGKILYRLFDNGETKAAATSVYQHLKSINSTRANFWNDVKDSQAFKEYEYFKKGIQELESDLADMEKWEDYMYLTGFNMDFNDDASKFRKWFINKSKEFNYRLLKDIGRAATLYYDEAEYNNMKKTTKFETNVV